MKAIQQINIWVNGENKVGEYFKVTCINDNYENQATNYWQIYAKILNQDGIDEPGQQIADGNLTISGQDYINWGDQPAMSINDWIYNWSASQLNLVII